MCFGCSKEPSHCHDAQTDQHLCCLGTTKTHFFLVCVLIYKPWLADTLSYGWLLGWTLLSERFQFPLVWPPCQWLSQTGLQIKCTLFNWLWCMYCGVQSCCEFVWSYWKYECRGTVKLVLNGHSQKDHNWFSRHIIALCRSKVLQNAPKGAFCNIFQPTLRYHLSLKSLFCLLTSGCFTQVLLHLYRVKEEQYGCP